MSRVLIIEDEEFKARRIEAFVSSFLPVFQVIAERSVTSGLSRLFTEEFSVLLLDMSLSTFDVSATESGGRPQNFGGMAVLEHMRRRKRHVPTIVITQFPSFRRDGVDVGLEQIEKEMLERYSELFRGLIYYSSRESTWEKHLSSALAFLEGTGA